MKQKLTRAAALILACLLCLSMAACGDKSGSDAASAGGKNTASGTASAPALAQELGYGYLSEYSDLGDVELEYVSSVSVAQGKLYLYGEWYDDTTFESGNRLYARDLSTGETVSIPVPALEQGDNVSEYIQQVSVCPDGSGFWMITDRYTYSSDWSDEPEPVEAYEEAVESTEDAEDAAGDTAEPLDGDAPLDESGAVGAAEPEYSLNLLSASVSPETDDLSGLITEGGDEPEYLTDMDTAGETAEEGVTDETEDLGTLDDTDQVLDYYPDYSENNETHFAKRCDLEGNILLTIDLTEATRDLDYFYCQSAAQDGQGNLYLASDTTLLGYDKDGNALPRVEVTDMYVQSMVSAGDGTVLVSGWDYSGDNGSMGVYRLDGGSLTPLDWDAIDPTGRCDLYPGDGSTVLMNDGTLLWSLDTATGQGVKLLSWLDSDVNGNNIEAVAMNGEDTVLVLLSSYHRSGGFQFELGTLKKTPVAEIPARTILSLGAVYLDSTVQDAMIRFNRSDDTYRITLVDYSTYNTDEDYSAGATQLERDIIAGSGPDILYLSNGHVEKYIGKGALADLSAQIDQDNDFSLEDLVAGPLKAYTVDGKLYAMPYSFSLGTMYASAKLVGDRDRWTLQDMKEIIDGLDEDVRIMQWGTQQDFLNTMVYMALPLFVNYADATCSFDTEEFKSLLAVCAKLPADWSYYESGDDGDAVAYSDSDEMTMLQSGDMLLSTGYGVSDSYAIKNMYRLYTRDNGIVRIGFPTESGNGALLSIYNTLAVSSRCGDQAGAWRFIKTMLSDQVQQDVWQLPMRKSQFDKLLEEAMTQDSYTDENGETVYVESTGWLGGTEVKMGELTQEQADAFREYVDGASIAGTYDEDLMEILNDETAAYFAGDKSADEVAKLIQSRVSIYLGETS